MTHKKPKVSNDLFWFQDYILFLKEKLDHTKESQVVWIHGDYGSWKTTSMNLLSELYSSKVWWDCDNILSYSAWRNYYDKPDTVWKSLLYELAGKIYDVFSEESFSKNFTQTEKLEIDTNTEKDTLKESTWEKYLKKDVLSFFSKNIETNRDFDEIIKYIQYTTKEIQINLYHEVKDQEGILKWQTSKASQEPWKALAETWKVVIWVISSLLGGKLEEVPKQLFEVCNLLKKDEQELKKAKIDSLEIIQRKFDILLKFYNLFFDVPLIIMVDDMDRILPEKSVELLEILRIFFEKSERIHFVVAIDIRVIEKGIERKFNQLKKDDEMSRIEMEEYLEKIITIPFNLPAIPLVKLWELCWVDELIRNELRNIGNNYQPPKDDKEMKGITISINTEEIEDVHSKFQKFSEILCSENSDANIFNSVVTTWLQANPRKIKRFLNVFEIYYKILLYRSWKDKSSQNWKNELENAIILAKMLIIKLEWDEVYKEFVRDKFYLCALEYVHLLEQNKWEILSFELWGLIKPSKQYKMANLFGMLSIKPYLSEYSRINGIQTISPDETIRRIYPIYYLISWVSEKFSLEKNENIENIFKFNLLRYLYEGNDLKVDMYVKLFWVGNENVAKDIIAGYKEYKNNEEIVQLTKITNL